MNPQAIHDLADELTARTKGTCDECDEGRTCLYHIGFSDGATILAAYLADDARS